MRLCIFLAIQSWYLTEVFTKELLLKPCPDGSFVLQLMLSDMDDAIAGIFQICVSLPSISPPLCPILSLSFLTDRTIMIVAAINLNDHRTCLALGYQEIRNIV